MSHRTLVSPETLRALLAGAEPPRVLDASFDLGDTAAGERSHLAAHVPGSLYVHLDRDLSSTRTGRNGRHPLPERAAFAATVGRWGITPQTQVVALDRQGGMYASRLWWLLRWLGHEHVAVLDGGFVAWLAAGGGSAVDVETAQPAVPYPERAPLVAMIDSATLQSRLGRQTVLDARSPERFRGDREPVDPVAGHIPGALNRFNAANLVDGRFKPAEKLRAEFHAALGHRPASEVIHSCGSGVTACHNLLAMEHAGLHGSVLYPGSWSEWSSDSSRPIARS